MISVQNLMIDEADEAMPGQQSSRKRSSSESPASPRPNKRKPGMLFALFVTPGVFLALFIFHCVIINANLVCLLT